MYLVVFDYESMIVELGVVSEDDVFGFCGEFDFCGDFEGDVVCVCC